MLAANDAEIPLRDAFVLVYGRDSVLLDSRRKVLEQAGYRVLAVTSVQQIFVIKDLHQPEVMVLCHTVKPEERELALAIGRAANPAMKTVVMTVPHRESGPQNADVMLMASEGPKALLKAVASLLAFDPPHYTSCTTTGLQIPLPSIR